VSSIIPKTDQLPAALLGARNVSWTRGWAGRGSEGARETTGSRAEIIRIRCGAAMELPVSLTAAPPSEVVGTSAGSKEGEGQVRGKSWPLIGWASAAFP